jgi:hypothetical protein
LHGVALTEGFMQVVAGDLVVFVRSRCEQAATSPFRSYDLSDGDGGGQEALNSAASVVRCR